MSVPEDVSPLLGYYSIEFPVLSWLIWTSNRQRFVRLLFDNNSVHRPLSVQLVSDNREHVQIRLYSIYNITLHFVEKIHFLFVLGGNCY
ncbi:hypothetical protein Y032_0121g1027 [Ancylostoma ceylanicum]|uniref:Uncharacterized protein n=1 Tax=Ancylostoma ceylanicum TaxID=53326 RepID=A0A016T9I4_9BILA|nr:hypothetical protein Y032_0121g1027 [Ancylostoma ceylanicum]